MNGMHRAIDQLGRVVIPMEYRKDLKIKDGDELDMAFIDNSIILTPRKSVCVICGSTEHLHQLNGKAICQNCISETVKLSKAIEV